jgi:hypothetical protein
MRQRPSVPSEPSTGSTSWPAISANKATVALEKDIRDWITNWNDNPKPFTWTKTADEILERLASYIQRIPGAGH